jgi:trans-aconitate methyltransferase
MADIKATRYWDTRYTTGGNSGYGSYNEQLTKKINWLSNLNIQSIIEIGCGDFNFGKNLLYKYPNVTYKGFDISPHIININKINYPQYQFEMMTEDLPDADLILCIDVLLHILDDKEYELMLQRLEKLWKNAKYLAVTSYEYNHDLGNHVKIRNFDWKRFGNPTIREIVEEKVKTDRKYYFAK